MIRKFAILILSLLLLLFGMEKCYDFFLMKNVNLKSSYVNTHKIDADVLFLGPCEPLWMMDPDLFQKYTGLKAYNLSTVHANFAENQLMLELYLRANKRPKYLFLYVTGESVDGTFNVFNTYNFPQFIGYHRSFIKSIVQAQDSSYIYHEFFPFLKYAYYNDFVNFNAFQGLKHFLAGRSIPYFPNGYVRPHGIVWDGRLERFEKEHPKGYTFKWAPEEYGYLLDLLEMGYRNDIQIILYESPMLNEIKPFLLNRDEIKNKISNFAGEYGNNVPYWVFDTMKISDSRDYFFSILNTNNKGSAIFNKTFADYFNQWQKNNSSLK